MEKRFKNGFKQPLEKALDLKGKLIGLRNCPITANCSIKRTFGLQPTVRLQFCRLIICSAKYSSLCTNHI